LPRVDLHAGVFIHLAQRLETIHRDGGAPCPQAVRGFALRRLLVGVRPLAATSAGAARALRRTREAFGRAIHQLDLTDPRFEDVVERGIGALVRHAAIAVCDRADVHATDY